MKQVVISVYMKLFLVLGVLAAAYCYMLMHTTDLVMAQTQHINDTYQYVASHADQLAGAR